MTQYFVTKKDSETGKKFSAIHEKRSIIIKQIEELRQKYGFTKTYINGWNAFGGIESVCFDNPPDMKLWKKSVSKDPIGYSPRLNSKEGQEIKKDLSKVDGISREDLNDCVDTKLGCLYGIGFSFDKNTDYFGFMINHDWNVNIPVDCEEVTASKYMELTKAER